MKGTIIKGQSGWIVMFFNGNEYRQPQHTLPLHPDLAQMMDKCFTSKFTYEADFEVVHLSKDPLGRDIKPYAKPISSFGKSLFVEIMEQDDKDGLHQDNDEKLINDFVQELIDAKSIREHEKSWISNICYHVFCIARNKYRYDYSQECKCKSRIGETWCCNQCGLPCRKSESTYTEEQVREAMYKARDIRFVTYSDDEIVESLKQPKQ